MLRASCLGICYFLSFRGQHGLGEARGDAGAWRRCAAAPAQRSGEPTAIQLPKVGNHLLERLLRSFSFHNKVFCGTDLALDSKTGISSLGLGCASGM